MTKIEISNEDALPREMPSRPIGENIASSSGSNPREILLGMGFKQSLIKKVIQEKGEEDINLLLETILKYSAREKSQSISSDSDDVILIEDINELAADSHPEKVNVKSNPGSPESLDSLFGDDNDTSFSPPTEGYICPKEELVVHDENDDDRRSTLLMMDFSPKEVNNAIASLGEDAPLNETVDFILASQIAESQGLVPDQNYIVRNQEANNESSFGTIDKTFRLLELGFTENQISVAIEKYGKETPITELADSIFRDILAGESEDLPAPFHKDSSGTRTGNQSSSREMEGSSSVPCQRDLHLERDKGKRPKFVHTDELRLSSSGKSLSVQQRAAKSPYFLYGNVFSLSKPCWKNISRFLYEIEPEFVNTQFFSAMSRTEGYIHNLPRENRFLICPKPPMPINDAPTDPEHLERILGYPTNHTRAAEFTHSERVHFLEHCFQTDTLGYHLSVLKALFPKGVRLLSIYSGIGGAEVALHRLGIQLKSVVAVETCEKKRRIFKNWWVNSIQTGELVQVESIQKLTTTKIKSLIDKVGGFDFIICQSPYKYSSKTPSTAADDGSFDALDISLFYEFVRILQCVRSIMERK